MIFLALFAVFLFVLAMMFSDNSGNGGASGGMV
jgi:hypothetical protein